MSQIIGGGGGMYTVVSLVSCFITRTHTGLSHYKGEISCCSETCVCNTKIVIVWPFTL